MMDWIIAIVGVAVVAAFLLMKRLALVSEAQARERLASGALVIDVRSREEFRAGHVSDAINVPLPELRESFPRQFKDKNQTVLVYCLSGGRSAIAQQQLKGLGFPNVFNLGSLERARRVVRK
jgi:phage shock protein E